MKAQLGVFGHKLLLFVLVLARTESANFNVWQPLHTAQLSRHCHNQKLRCAANSLFEYSEDIRKEILAFNQSALP
jgi:hypothetical protein